MVFISVKNVTIAMTKLLSLKKWRPAADILIPFLIKLPTVAAIIPFLKAKLVAAYIIIPVMTGLSP